MGCFFSRSIKVCGFLLLFFVLLSDSSAQIDSLGNKILNNMDTLRMAKVDFGSVKIVPYIAPSYMPETEWLFSAGGLLTFKVQEWNRFLNLSSIPFSLGYSTNGSFTISIQNVIYWTNDNLRATGEFQLRDMPDHYWGVGYENALNVPRTDSTTAYRRHYLRFYERILFRLNKGLFVGFMVDFNGTEASNLNNRMVADEDVLQSGTSVFNSGLGAVVEYDTRDFVQNAYEGVYLSGSILMFDEFLGGNTNFKVFELDYRQYVKIRRDRRTIAWQYKNRFCIGKNVPWTDMAMLGGVSNMRGYTLGRFRDQQMVHATVEYRHMFQRRTPNKKGNYKSPLGYVAWCGVGAVAPSIDQMKHWLPNAGIGLRLEIQPRMNVRFDYGFAKGEQGTYITFSEAF